MLDLRPVTFKKRKKLLIATAAHEIKPGQLYDVAYSHYILVSTGKETKFMGKKSNLKFIIIRKRYGGK